MRTRGTRKLIAGVAALGLVVAACGGDDDSTAPDDTSAPTTAAEDPGDDPDEDPGDDPDEDPGDDPDEDPGDDAADEPADDAESGDGCTADRMGGELTMVAGAVILTPGLDPIVALGASYGNTETLAVFDSLMRFNPDTGLIEPHVAESLEANEDHTVYTMRLREGITFGNGDPLTSEAVVYSTERLAASPRVAAGMAQEIESMETPDDLTVVFNLRDTWVGFPYLFAHSGGFVVHPGLAEERGEEFATNPLGGGVGPYEFVRYAPGEEIILEAKDDYWGGPVCIETIRLVNISGDQGRYDAFANDEIDGVFMTDAAVIAEMRDDGVEELAWLGSGRGFHLNSGRGDDPVLADVRLRRAIGHALDLDLLNERVWGGAAVPNSGLTHPSQLMHSGVDGPQHDPDLSRELVQEYVDETGEQPVVNIVCSDTQENTELAINVGAMLEQVGFGIDVENLAGGVANERVLIDGDYDVGCAFAAIFDESPERALGQYVTGSPRNRVGFGHPDMDAAIAQLNTVFEPEDRAEVLAEIQELWNEHMPGAYVVSSEWYIGLQDHVKGVQPSIAGVLMFQDAWLDQG